MKKLFALVLAFCMLFTLTGCKKNVLTEEDIKAVITENKLNVLNNKNCGYKGEELELEIEAVTIEKSNVFEDDASCDALVLLSSKNVTAEVFYRFDLSKEKKQWKMKTVKNYKKFSLAPKKGIEDDTVLSHLEAIYPDGYTFNVDSNEFNADATTCEVAVSYEKKSDISVLTGTFVIDCSFDINTLSWTIENIRQEASHVEEFNPNGQWRFTDNKYFYKINISGNNFSGETAEIKVITSEYESVIDTADYQQSFNVSVTPSQNSLYFEPFDVETGEETSTIMLCAREDGMYFCTPATDGYVKVNLDRHTEKTY